PRSCKYVNGYDQLRAYLMFDFLDSDGLYHRNTNMYVGWEVSGVIGDVNGDGNPNTSAVLNGKDPCGQKAPDLPGIDGGDDYSIFLHKCASTPGALGDEIAEIRITNNGIFAFGPTEVLFLSVQGVVLVNNAGGALFQFAPDRDAGGSNITAGSTLK